MDLTDKKRRTNLALLFITLLGSFLLMAWMWYDAWIVRHDPLDLFSGGRTGFFMVLGIFFLVLVVFCITFTRKIPFNPSSGNDSAPSGDTGQAPAYSAMGPLSPAQEKLFGYGSAAFLSIFLIGNMYAFSHSLPLTLIFIAAILICIGITRVLVSSREIRWVVFSAMIFVPFIFLLMVGSSYLNVPGFLPVPVLLQIVTQPVTLICALILVILPIGCWMSVSGIPFLRPLTDADLQDLYEEEIVLTLPFERAFERCRDSVRLLPDNQITTSDPIFGTLSASASPGWGRAITVSFTLEKITDGKTRVKISSISPVPTGENEPRKRTRVNRKYVKILVSYLQAQ